MSNLIESFEIKLSFSTLFIKIVNCGNDCSVSFFGGDKAHIGCAVLAIPRESLLENGEVSCTISTLNVTGHKDDEIARLIAKKIAPHEIASFPAQSASTKTKSPKKRF